MRFEACNDPDCEQFITNWWPDIAPCIFSGSFDFTSLTCDYYGGCSRSSQDWSCQDASNLISDMLAQSPSVLFRAEQFLHGPCFCQSASHTGDPTCEENVSAILPDTLLAMSRLVQNQTLLCGDDSAGQGGTCEQCQEEAGGVTYS